MNIVQRLWSVIAANFLSKFHSVNAKEDKSSLDINPARPAKVIGNSPFTIDVNNFERHDELEVILCDRSECVIPNFEEEELNNLKRDFSQSINPLGMIKLENVYVFGSGFLMNSGKKRIVSKYLPYTNVNTEKGVKLSSGSIRDIGDGQWRTRPLNIVEIEEPAVLLSQPGDTIFGHWLVDLIPMYSLFKKSGINARPIVKRSVLAGKSISDIDGIFNILGLRKSEVIGATENLEVLYCKELYVPSAVRYGQQIHPYAIELYNEYRIKPRKKNSAKKIYFSRRHWAPSGAHRILRNAEEVENFYKENGFEIVYPERISFSEKLDLVSNAVEVVGEKGTALHLTLFSKTIKKVTVLLNPSEAMTGLPLLQGELCRLQGVECKYIVGKVIEGNQGFTIAPR